MTFPRDASAVSNFLGRIEGVDWTLDEEPRPFLSVVMRTQGQRSALLKDALVCLAAQINQDFEVLIALHDPLDPSLASTLRSLADSETPSLSSRLTVLESHGGSRSRPLNDAVGVARGRYLAFFDDDDLLLANWVSTFADLAEQHPGRVLRSVVVDQEFTHERWGDDLGLIASGPVIYAYPDAFTLHSGDRVSITIPPAPFARPISFK